MKKSEEKGVPALFLAHCALALGVAAFLTGCAADFPGGIPSPTQPSSSSTSSSARFTFNNIDYYSLTDPIYDTSCAGDAKNYYDPFTVSSANDYVPFPTNPADPTATLRPAFIKNVSVDLTDANTPLSTNKAYACSMGSSVGVPLPSSCATFDYGAINGVPTSMGGSFLLIGGIQSPDYVSSSSNTGQGMGLSCGAVLPSNLLSGTSGYNQCWPSVYSLGIDSLPPRAAGTSLAPGLMTGSASSAISLFTDFSGAQGYAGPQGLAGAMAAYSPGAAKIVVFGGSMTLPSGNGFGPGGTSNDTWTFDLSTQTWTNQQPKANVDSSISTMYDNDTSYIYSLTKAPAPRSLAGYTTLPGVAISAMSTNGTTANIDLTDRIAIVAGYQSNANHGAADTRRFNPTYGPDWIDALNPTGALHVTNPFAANPVQWLDSYHTQSLNNTYTQSWFKPVFSGNTSGAFSSGFGMVSLVNNTGGGNPQAGYLFTSGGFDDLATKNTPAVAAGCAAPSLSCGGGAMLSYRRNFNETSAANFIGIPNWIDPTAGGQTGYHELTPSLWSVLDYAGIEANVPWYGATSLIPGFDRTQNDVINVGGTDCNDFLTHAAGSCSMTNAGAYWRMSSDPQTQLLTTKTLLPAGTTITMTAPPKAAGMATAHGFDGSGNPLIIAWGGLTDGSTPAAGSINFLAYPNGTAPPNGAATNLTWHLANPVSSSPTVYANASLVYSTVMHAFYLFGGYSPVSPSVSGDTWRLDVSGDCTGALPSCSFTWTKLSTSTGLTCSPNCPSARYSQRMVEVNYYNLNIGGSAQINGKFDCSNPDQPCSFGIFMEGGTPDGTTLLSDRWMFDPTANGGNGQWQLMTELPPRTLGAMAAADYFIPSLNKTVHRAILFGGETGLHSPSMGTKLNYYGAAPGHNYYVAPTLGDTWMYDFDKNTWNRVKLLGNGYNGAPPLTDPFGYDATIGGPLAELSPPPLSGAMMITRTLSSPEGTPLDLPEAYLIGGRTKDGKFNSLDHLYKFCPGSPGEQANGTCDAYNVSGNPTSNNPTDQYVGRWLRKQPAAPALGSYLGAGTYDPVHDRIVIMGGLVPSVLGKAITDTAAMAPTNAVYEYTPPSAAGADGSWSAAIPACGGIAPPARYGHTLAYDALHRQLVLVGGLDSTGTPITQTITYYLGSTPATYNTVDVWTATRDDVNNCYTWTQVSLFGNLPADAPSTTSPQSGLAFSAGIFIPATGYNSGYYTMFDSSCTGQGPIASTDQSVSKLMVGGAYIDIDRSQLGPNENLLLNLTFLPLGLGNTSPSGSAFTTNDNALFRIHLIKTGQTPSELTSILQPRDLFYAPLDRFPEVAQNISILAPPTGEIQEQQVLIPLSLDPGIDRIRIERYSGSGILIDATLFRMGYK